MDSDIEHRQLMRLYSFEIEPQDDNPDTLSRMLIEDRRQNEELASSAAPWRNLFETWAPEDCEDPTMKGLMVEAVNLSRLWKEFRDSIPDEDRTNFEARPPSVQGLVSMVEAVAQGFQAKREKTRKGKFMARFHRVCGTIGSHKAILEMLPKGNEYVSLFSGAMMSIITASANHEQISKGISDALTTIGDSIEACQTELSLYPTESMHKELASLYAHIFLFLKETMSWFLKKSRRRLLDSFNEKFYESFEEDIENIKHISDKIRRKAQQGMMGEIRAARLDIEALRADFRVGLRGTQRMQAEQEYTFMKFREEQKRIKAEEERLRRTRDQILDLVASQFNSLAKGEHLQITQGFARPAIFTDTPNSWRKDDILFNSRNLEDYFSRDRLRPVIDKNTAFRISARTLSQLREWIQSKDTHILYISDEASLAPHNWLSTTAWIAVKTIHILEEAKVPIISYFCQAPDDYDEEDSSTPESKTAVELMSALLRQIIEQIVSLAFESELDFSEMRFAKVTFENGAWGDGLSLLNDLLPMIPSLVCIVLSGIEWADDASTELFFTGLVKALRNTKLKVLFTSSKKARSLLGELERDEMLVLDRGGKGWNLSEDVIFAS